MLGFLLFSYLSLNQYNIVEVSKGILPIDKHRPTIDEKYGIKIFISSREDAVFKISNVLVSDSWATKYSKLKDKDVRILCLKYSQRSSYSDKSWNILKMVHLRSNKVISDDFSLNVKWRCENPAWNLKWHDLEKLHK